MNRQEYNELVDQIEAKNIERPNWLFPKTKRLAQLSMAYLLGLIILTSAVFACAIWIVIVSKDAMGAGIVLGIFSALTLFSLARLVWFRFDPLPGVLVKRDQVPKLFELLDELHAVHAGAKLDGVVIDGDFNASIVRASRLGIFGWYKTVLQLGLPLMHALEPDEFRAVLAHEFGHLAHGDGAEGGEIYLMRASWERYITFWQEAGGSWTLVPFLNWFWPRFNAHAFVLSRQQEYRADKFSAELVGPDLIARALQRSQIRDRFMHEVIWPDIANRVNDSEEAPTQAISDVCQAISGPVPADKLTEWSQQLFLRISDRSDTHPSLRDRFAALGVAPPVTSDQITVQPLEQITTTAAHAFLGAAVNDLMQRVDQIWLEESKLIWKENHHYIKDLREDLGPEEEATTPELIKEWARIHAMTENLDTAQVWVERLLRVAPSDLFGRMMQAQLWLKWSDLRGVDELERIVNMNVVESMQAIDHLRDYYLSLGSTKDLDRLDKRADELEQQLAEAFEEFNVFNADTALQAVIITPLIQRRLYGLFKEDKSIYAVHLAKRHSTILPEVFINIMVVEFKYPALKLRSSGASQESLEKILHSEILDGPLTVLSKEIEGVDRKAIKQIVKFPGSKVYSRD